MSKTIECRSLPLVIADILSLSPSKYIEISYKQEVSAFKDLLQSPIFEDEFDVDEHDFDKISIQIAEDHSPIDVLFGIRLKNDYYCSMIDLLGIDTIFLYNTRGDLLELGDLLREIYALGTIPADGDSRLTKIYDKIHKFFCFASRISISIGSYTLLTELDMHSAKFETISTEYIEKIAHVVSMIYAYNYLESNSGRNPISNPAEIAKMVFDLLEKELDKHPYDKPDPKIYKYMDHRDCIFELLDRLFAILKEYDETGYAPSILTNPKHFLYEIMKSYK